MPVTQLRPRAMGSVDSVARRGASAACTKPGFGPSRSDSYAGVVGSLALAWSLSERDFGQSARKAFLPWAGLHVALAATALWLLAQPMEMRGTFL
ncbi:MAG: hypothetical protein R3F17_04940 [Planctomycetota bacterium]